jgi:hypothetical protein
MSSLKMVACVNCALLTRADRKMCMHGNHFRDERERPPLHQKPTDEDREAYFIWLSQQGVHPIVH